MTHIQLNSPLGNVQEIDLSESLELPPNPLASTSALAESLDIYANDVPAFINDLLAPQAAAGLPDLDKSLNELLTKLSLLSQDTSATLEQAIHDVSRTVPRLTYDLQFMRESAVELQGSLRSVQHRVQTQTAGGGESKTRQSLDRLTYLDKVKTRMESARDVLREAESWFTLESEVTALLASQSFDKAAERLAEASKSMVVFQNTPAEYDTRKSLMVSLQNQLEASLSSALVGAINNKDTASCRRFYDIFGKVEREHEFRNYYNAARRAAIGKEWNSVLLLDCANNSTEGDAPITFSSFLPRFYSSLLATLNEERVQIPLIFPDPQPTIATFLQSTLDALSPSLPDRLSSAADHYGAEALPELIKLLKSTEEFAQSVQAVMDKLAFNSQGGQVSGVAISASPTSVSPTEAAAKAAAARRHSRRFSRAIGSTTESASFSLAAWETALFEPFLDFQSNYATLERRFLSHQLKHDSTLVGKSKKDDAARDLWEHTITVFTMAEESLARCTAFTHGYGAVGLISALNSAFAAFLDSSQTSVLEAAASKGTSSTGTRDELDFEGLDYSTEDWSTFQIGLHLLETSRGIRERLETFEGKLHFALTNVAQSFHASRTDPHGFYFTNTTRGAISLLQQSALNSAELHTLVDSLPTSSNHLPLSGARDAVVDFTRACQLFLQTIILTPLQTLLTRYSSLPVWSQPDKQVRRGELQIPSFSLSPTDTIARVAEGLLNLLRLFEVYAADDALAFSIETLPFVDVETLAAVAAEQSKPSSPVDQTKQLHHAPQLGPETVLATWVSSLALSLLSHLTKITLPAIRSLSTSGASQLASDLGYLSNAVRALDVEWDELEKWREAAELKDTDLAAALEDKDNEIFQRVAKLRGWQ